MEAITTAISTALSTVATDALGVVGAVIPVAAPILGAGIAISLGIKYFKKASGARG